MSDTFDELFEGLRGQQPPASFAPAAAVRRRGRQRANRQAVSIGVAVFAVTGLGAGGVVAALGEGEQPVPPASPPATVESPAPTESPLPEPSDVPTQAAAAWLLTTEDLPGDGWQEQTGEIIDGPWYWDGAQPWCPEYRIEDFPSVARKVDFNTRGWVRDGAALLERVDQVVELYEPGAGAGNLDDVRAFIELCSRRPAEGDQVAPTYYEIEDTGVAGEESLLIRVEPYLVDDEENVVPAGEPEYVAVVRVGDVVTTIRFLNVPDGDMREVAQRAADRLGG